MKHVKILDTTLRDGGRIINNAFPDEHIKGIAQGLCSAGVDVVEMGFLRSGIEYNGNSTYFTEVEQFKKFIPADRQNTMFVGFGDYGKEFHMWDFSKLPECDGSSITGMRIGFRKKDLYNAIETCNIVKDKGYTLFIQGVESLNYTDKEMLEAIEVVNKIEPACFGIVDTYGAMYKDDVLRLFNLVHNNMAEGIAIDFHSHNNLQLSFSFAQEIVEAAAGKRDVVIDATMEGVGKGIGNLNTELLMDYLNRKHAYTYDIDRLFDTIDEYITYIKEKESWAYQIPYFMAGIYSSHANNIIYLMEKHKLSTKDIKHILSMIEPEKRKRYDYDNIERLYIEYANSKVDDEGTLAALRASLAGRKVLVLVPGHSLVKYEQEINKLIADEDPVVISVNFADHRGNDRFAFFGNPRRYNRCRDELAGTKVIRTSNVQSDAENEYAVNYNSLINRGVKYFDNSVIMLLKLLRKLGNEDIILAGFDGFSSSAQGNFSDEFYNPNVSEDEFDRLNADITKLLREYSRTLKNKKSVGFLTPSRFQGIFDDALI